MIRPILTVTDKKAILTYDIKNISGLSNAVQQVLNLLKEAAKRSEYFEAKRGTMIKIDQKNPQSTILRMHFIVPILFRDKAALEKLLSPPAVTHTTLIP